MIELLSQIHPTIIVAIIGLPITIILAKFKSKLTKEEESEKAFHALAGDLIKDNMQKLMDQNQRLDQKIDKLEGKTNISDKEIEELREQVYRLKMKTIAFRAMLEMFANTVDQMISVHGTVTEEDFEDMLRAHKNSIDEALLSLES